MSIAHPHLLALTLVELPDLAHHGVLLALLELQAVRKRNVVRGSGPGSRIRVHVRGDVHGHGRARLLRATGILDYELNHLLPVGLREAVRQQESVRGLVGVLASVVGELQRGNPVLDVYVEDVVVVLTVKHLVRGNYRGGSGSSGGGVLGAGHDLPDALPLQGDHAPLVGVRLAIRVPHCLDLAILGTWLLKGRNILHLEALGGVTLRRVLGLRVAGLPLRDGGVERSDEVLIQKAVLQALAKDPHHAVRGASDEEGKGGPGRGDEVNRPGAPRHLQDLHALPRLGVPDPARAVLAR